MHTGFRNILPTRNGSLILTTLVIAAFVSAGAGCSENPAAPDRQFPGDSLETTDQSAATVLVTAFGRERVIGAGANVQLKATAWDSDLALLDRASFRWTSADSLVATVDSTGLTTTVGLGSVEIRASSGVAAGRIRLHVLPEGVQSLELRAAQQVLPDRGYQETLSYSALDALGNPVPHATVTWESGDDTIVAVDDQGTVTTDRPGRTNIVAESDSATASLPVEVVAVTGDGRTSVDLELLRLLRGLSSSGVLRPPSGMSVALVRDGRLVMARGYGTIDVNAEESVKPSSLFRIASISKPLTAVAVMQLVEGGLLSLDDHLLDVAPDLIPDGGVADPAARDITVRNLLEHKGGWDRTVPPNPLFILPEIASTMGVPSPPSRSAFARWVFQRDLHFVPGSRYTYNNVNYVMLGEVIEAVSGMPYETYVRDAVLAPSGVTKMQVGSTLRTDRAVDEVFYQYGGVSPSVFDDVPGQLPDQYGGRFNLTMTGSSGGWIGSAVDLVRFAVAVTTPSLLLSSASHEYMTSDHSGAGVYGAGWVIEAGGFNHSGSLEGSNSILSVRDDGSVVAVLFNGNITIPFASFIDPVLAVSDWPVDDLFDKY